MLDTFLLLVHLTRSGDTAAASCLLYHHQHRALCSAFISDLPFCWSTAAACPMPQQQPMPATLITAIRKVSTISQYYPTNKNPHGNCANFAYHEIIKHPSARRKIYIKEIMPAARAVTLLNLYINLVFKAALWFIALDSYYALFNSFLYLIFTFFFVNYLWKLLIKFHMKVIETFFRVHCFYINHIHKINYI